LTLLDTNAVVALLRGEPGGPEVATLIRDRPCVIPATCLSEVVDIMLRTSGANPELLSERLGALLTESVTALTVDPGLAWSAGRIRAAHYRRKTAELSLADCVLLASAGPEDEIATSDRAVAATARKLDITVIPLLDSQGGRPEAG